MPTVRTDPFVVISHVAAVQLCTDENFTGCDKSGAGFDTAGNRYDLTNVGVRMSSADGYSRNNKLTFTGQITPPSDITLDRVVFSVTKTVDTTTITITTVDIGDIGQSLTANTTYQIVVEVTLQAPSSF